MAWLKGLEVLDERRFVVQPVASREKLARLRLKATQTKSAGAPFAPVRGAENVACARAH